MQAMGKSHRKEVSRHMKEYFDFLLTACYDCEDDIGLAEAWDAVNEVVKMLDFMDGAEKCVLGTIRGRRRKVKVFYLLFNELFN